tara:strand:+ start:1153 stop:1332 length:180 start_codon:yes stop_codon:yes gene_type:complete
LVDFLPAFFTGSFSLVRILAPASNSASSFAERISALVLLFLFGFSSPGGFVVAKVLLAV